MGRASACSPRIYASGETLLALKSRLRSVDDLLEKRREAVMHRTGTQLKTHARKADVSKDVRLIARNSSPEVLDQFSGTNRRTKILNVPSLPLLPARISVTSVPGPQPAF